MAGDPIINRETAWSVYRKLKPEVLEWFASLPDTRAVHAVHFIPHDDSLEVYVFFETDEDLAAQRAAGTLEKIGQRFEDGFDADGLGPKAGVPVRFEFDSHENVQRNFQGNYFFRLR